VGGGRALPRKKLIFYLKIVSFGAFWVALPHCVATAQESEAEEEKKKEPW